MTSIAKIEELRGLLAAEKLVEECARIIDYKPKSEEDDLLAHEYARAVIRRTLEYAAEGSRIWGYQNGRQTEDDNNGWCNEQAGEAIADHLRALARSLPKAEGEK